MPKRRNVKEQRKINKDKNATIRRSHHHESLSFSSRLCLLSCPVKDCMAKPVGRSIESAVEDFSADDGAGQHHEESSCFGSCRADAGVDNALQEDFDAGGVHEEGRYEVVAFES
jgi:hypothetical protein